MAIGADAIDQAGAQPTQRAIFQEDLSTCEMKPYDLIKRSRPKYDDLLDAVRKDGVAWEGDQDTALGRRNGRRARGLLRLLLFHHLLIFL